MGVKAATAGASRLVRPGEGIGGVGRVPSDKGYRLERDRE